MRVKQEGKQSNPSDRAVKAVAGPNSNLNKKKQSHPKVYYHKFYNVKECQNDEKSTYDLLRLGEGFKKWAEQLTGPKYIQTYWLKHGITMQTLRNLCQTEPEFAELVNAGKHELGERWGEVILGERESPIDRFILRQRASVYLTEWGWHDKEQRLETEQAKADLVEIQKKQEESNKIINVHMVDYGKEDTSVEEK